MIDLKKVQAAIDESYQQFHQAPGGKNADYIPFLKEIDSSLSALVVVTANGDVLSAGQSDYRFALESNSKVCTLALALKDVGAEAVLEKVGASPTGLPFNSVMALELHGESPLSPLVNAGAMATVSLIKATSVEDRWARVLDFQRQLAGSKAINLSEELNQSEQTTNFHNRGIAWLLYSSGYLYCDPMEACDVYTRQCSTLVTTTELATMGATIAAGGLNPITKELVIPAEHCAPILAEMMMEGMYDGSGVWAYTVGLPSKSGVGGGVLSIVPGKLAIAAFSPPLDQFGNSIRAQKMIAAVAKTLGYNLYSGR